MSYNHSFRLILNRWPADDEWDNIADTCHDAGLGFGKSNGVPQAEFDRSSGSLVEAIALAVYELAEHHRIETVAVEPVHLLWMTDVADRVGMSVAELEARIEASPVAHSKPMLAEGGLFYHWPDIVDWLSAHGIPALAYDQTIRAANTMLEKLPPEDRTKDRMVRSIAHELNRIDMWRMPEWMEPYRSFIAETGGNEIEELLFRFEHEHNLMRTNVVAFTLACMARAQVGLLERLHKDGSLPPAPNGPGGW